jgi:hypothetical protein
MSKKICPIMSRIEVFEYSSEPHWVDCQEERCAFWLIVEQKDTDKKGMGCALTLTATFTAINAMKHGT